MSASPLRAPRTIVHFAAERKGDPCSSISVGLSEGASSAVAWRIRLDAITNGGRMRLGTILTAPPSRLRLPVRVVALACCPGAVGWDFKVEPIAPYPANVGAFLKVESCTEGATLGIVPCDGSALLNGPEGAGAYNHATAGNPAIPVGARVQGWSLIAGAGVATLDITSPIFGGLPQIAVPAGATFGDSPRNIVGPATFTFGGVIASRWVSWSELVG